MLDRIHDHKINRID
nr:hypothetical protein [Leisingera sp. M523]